MAQATVGTSCGAAALAAAVVTQLPWGVPTVLILACTAVTIGVAVAVWLLRDRLGQVHYGGTAILGTVMITAIVYASPTVLMAMSLATLYIPVACCGFFYTRPQSACLIGFAVACCMTVLALRPAWPWWSGLMTSGVTVSIGLVVAILARAAADSDTDSLTGVLNRKGFDRTLNGEIGRAERSGPGLAVVLFDVDGVGALNDQWGYLTRDRALHQLARSWWELLDPGQSLARFGGDEFAVLLPGATERGAIDFVQRLRAAAKAATSFSAGVAVRQPGESASIVLSRAQAGLYRAKQAGRDRTVLEPSACSQVAVELADAIARQDLVVHYQPIVDLADEAAVVAVEALVRWNPPSGGDLLPDAVIRIAEATGLIAGVDRVVLHRACLDAPAMQAAVAPRRLTLNVNASGLALIEPDYVARVEDTLIATGWPAEQLVLEVTETVLEVDAPAAIAAVHALRARGVRIAIDDFGAGYSSLSRLHTLPADFLKLDGSFTAAITPEHPAPALLAAIAGLAGALGLPIIAEGVENAHQHAAVGSLGYRLAQGFYYGRPQTCAEIVDTVTRLHSLHGGRATAQRPCTVAPEETRRDDLRAARGPRGLADLRPTRTPQRLYCQRLSRVSPCVGALRHR
jgi:diguanylate cyclase (GGDEF)-like protein